jgi:hypothetical protein
MGGGPNVGTCSLSTALTLRFNANPQNAMKRFQAASAVDADQTKGGVVCAPPAHARGMMKVLPKTIKTRVNQFAHRSAQRHALMVRDSTLGKLQGMADDGATLPDLFAALAAIEATADAAAGGAAIKSLASSD